MKPILKWVGGKQWLSPLIVDEIRKHLTGTYYEPFFGGGAMFFELLPKKSYISDAIESLMITYTLIKQNPINVWNHLYKLSNQINEYNYYNNRSEFNNLTEQGIYNNKFAALFIYLNKTCYNGLWRQNKNEIYNVPYGKHKHIHMPLFHELINVSKSLQNTTIDTILKPKDTIDIINKSTNGDVIFADPPYYNKYQEYDSLFTPNKEFHKLLAISLYKATQRGVVIFTTNNECKEVLEWYKPFTNIKIYNKKQSISQTNKGRKSWNQLIISNVNFVL